MLDHVFDLPIGHLGRAFVVPADYGFSLGPRLDQLPAVMRAVLPQCTVVGPKRVLGFHRHRHGHIFGFFHRQCRLKRDGLRT